MEYGKCCFKTEIKVKEIEFLFKKKRKFNKYEIETGYTQEKR